MNNPAFVGNPDLKPEMSTSYDFIISNIFKEVQVDIDFFHSKINDQIKRVNHPDYPDKKINLNVWNSNFSGVEINTKFSVEGLLYGFAGYSYTKAKNEETDEELEFTFHNMANLGFSLRLNSFLALSSSLKYMDEWGKAPSYVLINSGINIQPNKSFPLLIEFKADNILDTDVLLPEIARNNKNVPTYPKAMSRKSYLGLLYNFNLNNEN